jgi:hypothetical protein
MSNTTLDNLINKKKIKAFFTSKDALIFLFFLLLSFCFWYLNSLRKNYEITIPVNVEYADIPTEKVNIDALPKTIQVTLKGHGSYLLPYKIKKTEPIFLNLKEVGVSSNKNLYISGDVLQYHIKSQLHNTTTIVKTNPPEILIPFVQKSEKRLKVIYAGNITFAQQYSFSDSINITPSHVIVYGDKNIIDTMQYLHTEKIDFKNLKDSIKKIVPLQKVPDVQYEIEHVNIHIPVEKYTEKTIEIPIIGINFPQEMELRTFPAMLKVSFFITFSKFNTVNNNDITATINYNDIINNKTGKQKPIIKTTNPFISNIRSNPDEIEYIMEHN